MSNTPAFLQNLLLILAPFRFAAEHEDYLRDLAAAVGWDLDEVAGFDAAAAAADLGAISRAVDSIANHLATPPGSLSEYLAILDELGRTFDAVRDLGRILGDAGEAHLDDFARALLEALTIASWFQRSPVSFSISEILGLVVAPDDGILLPAIRNGERLIRAEHRRGSLRLGRLKSLLRDPIETLREEYISGDALATTAGAHRAADKLFPRLARLAYLLGLNVRYGFQPAVPVTGGAVGLERLAHMLMLYVSPNDGDAYGATLALSSAERGRRGLLVRPFGTVAFQGEVGDWNLRLDGSGSIRGLLLGPDGVETSGDESWGLVLAAKRTDEIEAVPVTLGGGGTGITFGTVRFEGELKLGREARHATLNLVVERAHFALVGSDGDGFLANVLPPEGLSADFDFAVGWSNRNGFTFSGTAGLEATWPLHVPIGPVTLNSLSLGIAADDTIRAQVSFGVRLNLGPFAVQVDRVGLEALVDFPEDGGNLGVADLDFHFKPPNGLGLVIDAPTVVGGGYLRFDPQKEEYSGILQLEISERIAVNGMALLTTRAPDGGKGYSFVVIIFVEGFTPIQLGFGFTLTGIGGLLAINRTFDEAALRAGLKNHTLDSVLFPKDPIRNAPQILNSLNKVFPPATGHHLFGPAARIEWGTPTLITADLAVVLELGARLRLLILAQIVAILPKPENDLICLQMDAIGVLDFDQGTAALDATLYDSRLLKKFVLTGEMAMRLNWEGSPNFALAVGGLHPAFNPPPNFPKLERIALNLTAGDNPRFRCEAYFALTANTVQFGARAELYAAAAGFSIQGETGFEVLIQLDPFQFLAEFYAQVQLKRGSTNLFKVRVAGALAGPRPLHLKAKATFEVLWWDVSIRVDRTLVAGEKPPLPEPVDVLPPLIAALSHPGNWVSQLPAGQRPMVTLRARPEAPGEVLLHPLGTLTVKQGVVPLNMDISRFGSAAPAGARRFSISSVSLGGQDETPQFIRDFFAPAQFFEMSDGEKLSRPSFERMPAGISLGSDEIVFSPNRDDWLEVDAIKFETIIVDKENNETHPSGPEDLYTLTPVLLGRQARFGAASASDLRRSGKAKYRTIVAKHKIAKEGWSIVATDDLTVQPAPGAGEGKPMSYSEAEQALTQLKRENPAKAAGLKILRFQSEVVAKA
jgi:hypothetical protein